MERFRLLYAVIAVLGFLISDAYAGQVSYPINAPASGTSGHALTVGNTGTNPQSSIDAGAPPCLIANGCTLSTAIVSPVSGITSITTVGVVDSFQILGGTVSNGTSRGLAANNSASNVAGGWDYFKSRGVTYGTLGVVVSGDPVGQSIYYADDGVTSGGVITAVLGCNVDLLGTIATGIVPTYCVDRVSNSTGNTPNAVTNYQNVPLKIDSAGRVQNITGQIEACLNVLATSDCYHPGFTALLLQSEQLGTTPWATTNATVGASANTDPNGGTNAFTITDTSGASIGNNHQALTVTNDSGSYCVQGFVNEGASNTAASTSAILASFSGGTGVSFGTRASRLTLLGSPISSATNTTYGAGPIAPLIGATSSGWFLDWVLATNNTSGNTTLTINLQPDQAAGSGTGAADYYHVQVVKSSICPLPDIKTTTATIAVPAGFGPGPYAATNLAFVGQPPVVTLCGTNSLDGNATNNSGTLNVTGGTPASCTVTFANGGFPNYAHCTISPEALLAAFAYSYTKTVLTITATALSGKIDYRCDGA